MRLILLCTGMCVAFSFDGSAFFDGSAKVWEDGNLVPEAVTFAYQAGHAIAKPSKLRLPEAAPSEVRAIKSALAAPDQAIPRAFSKSELCTAAASVAEANDLPIPFFTNLIQQESGFKPHVVSPAGAQGIAQFMPRTAVAYGLTDPFDPIPALAASGRFLAELVEQFGNLGLAAAAYNAGPTRVKNFVTKRRKLPAETRQYVQSITGRPVEQWKFASQDEQMQLPAHARCPGSGSIEVWEGQRASKIRVAQVPSRTSRRQDKIALQTQPRPHAASSERSARKSKFVAAGPAARRFVAAATPSIMVPEKPSKSARPSRKPSLASIKTAKSRALESGAIGGAKRVRVASVR